VVLSAAAGKARDAATNNANLNGAYADMRSASRGDDTAPPVTATNPLLAYRLPDAGRLGGNFATAQGSFDQEKFAAQVASALSPSGYANAGGVDIGKQVSAARVFGDMLAALTKIEGRISAPGGF
jgi:hypothetical protein